MNKRRLKVLEMTRIFQFFTQTKFLSPSEVSYFINEYVSGNDVPINTLVSRSDIPMIYCQSIERLKEIINED